MTGVIRREETHRPRTATCRQRQSPGDASISQGRLGSPTNTRSWRGARKDPPLEPSGGEHGPPDTSISDSGTQDCETLYFCCLCHPHCGTLSQKLEDIDMLVSNNLYYILLKELAQFLSLDWTLDSTEVGPIGVPGNRPLMEALRMHLVLSLAFKAVPSA